MADFNAVHKIALSEASRNLRERRGDIWNIALAEPLGRFDATSMSETVTVMQISLDRAGNLHPANPWSLAAMQEWKERHKDTPDDAFEFPKDAFRAVVAPGEPS